MELYRESAAALSRMMQAGDISAASLCAEVLARARQMEPEVGAYVSLDPEGAMAIAERVDERRASGEWLPSLAGIPIALNDNLCVQGQNAAAACKPMFGSLHLNDAAVVETCKNAGLVILGKTNMDELSVGKRCADTPAQKTRNPRDLSRVPGGSSGGSAAALAAFEAVLALGTAYDGSIGIPSAYCGVVGLRPTNGALSCGGLLSIVPSLEQIGFMARCVPDLAQMAQLFYDKLGRIRVCQKTKLRRMDSEAQRYRLRGLKLGMPIQFFDKERDPAVSEAIKRAAERFVPLGAVLKELDIPNLRYAPPVHYTLSCAEAAARADKRRIEGIQHDFMAGELLRIVRKDLPSVGAAVKEMLMAGACALSSGRFQTTYQLALQRRTEVVRAFEEAFTQCDVLLAPGARQVAPPVISESSEVMEQPWSGDAAYTGADLAGLPALSLPCGEVRGLPVGLQLIAPAWHDHVLLNTGYAFERNN